MKRDRYDARLAVLASSSLLKFKSIRFIDVKVEVGEG